MRHSIGPKTTPPVGASSSAICVAHDGCRNTSVPDCPVPLCVKHLGRVYHFAHDHIEQARQHVHGNLQKHGGQPEWLSSGDVYFCRFDSRIKIGFSTQIDIRMSVLQPDELLTFAPGSRADESRLHRRFEYARVRGEWFEPVPELIEYIERVKESGRLMLDETLDAAPIEVR